MENFGDLLKIGIGEKNFGESSKLGDLRGKRFAIVQTGRNIIIAIMIINLLRSSVNWCALYRATSRVTEWHLA